MRHFSASECFSRLDRTASGHLKNFDLIKFLNSSLNIMPAGRERFSEFEINLVIK